MEKRLEQTPDQISAILAAAQKRAQELSLPYAGSLTPSEAYQVWQHAENSPQNAKLVDVRTRAELDWVGRIPEATELEWLSYPSNQTNTHFATELQQLISSDSLVMFICRSGQRSNNAATAATQAGFAQCYNILEGFEGTKDEAGHRGNTNGWRKAGLPWFQG